MGWTTILADRLLIRRIRQGDRAAAERFVTERYPSIYRLLYHLTGSADATDDLAQQTFVRAWQALSTFRGDASLLTWLHRIAYREYSQWLQGKSRLGESTGALEDISEIVSSERLPHPAETLMLRQALSDLPTEQQDAFLLYYVQGQSIREIATIVDAPEGTIKHRLFTARQRLRTALGPTTDAFDALPAPNKPLTSCEPQPGVSP